MPGYGGDVGPSAISLSASRSLRITCSGVCLRCCTAFILLCPTTVDKRTHSGGGSIRRGQVTITGWIWMRSGRLVSAKSGARAADPGSTDSAQKNLVVDS
jgi:hypothetical protein